MATKTKKTKEETVDSIEVDTTYHVHFLHSEKNANSLIIVDAPRLRLIEYYETNHLIFVPWTYHCFSLTPYREKWTADYKAIWNSTEFYDGIDKNSWFTQTPLPNAFLTHICTGWFDSDVPKEQESKEEAAMVMYRRFWNSTFNNHGYTFRDTTLFDKLVEGCDINRAYHETGKTGKRDRKIDLDDFIENWAKMTPDEVMAFPWPKGYPLDMDKNESKSGMDATNARFLSQFAK